jgi:hypothetical protein
VSLAEHVASIPLIDHHVHGTFTAELGRAEFEVHLNEGSPDPVPQWMTQFDSQLGFAIRRWCAPLLDMPACASADAYWTRRVELGVAEVTERLLRAAGVLLTDPRAVAGAGAWQRAVAAALARAADAAPGKAPLALRVAARAFASLADDLVRNAGGDPLDAPSPPAGVWDGYALVRGAVSAAFETANVVLRLDGRFDKKPSTAVGLRGAGTPSTLRGMAGDVPPLM